MGNYTRQLYHSSNPSWRNTRNLVTPAIGIEFETESRSGNYGRILELLPNFPRQDGPLVEQDGSLSRERGVEIIFPPIHPTQLKSSRGMFARAIKAIAPDAEGSRGTGMHMNVNVHTWTEDAKNTFLAVVNNLPAIQLANIGGRVPTRYCFRMPDVNPEYYMEETCDDSCAASYHGSRIEMRFPQSTTDHNKVRTLVDFITTLTTFSKKKAREFISVVRDEEECDSEINDEFCMCASCVYERGGSGISSSFKYAEGLELYYIHLRSTKKGRNVLEILFNGYPDEE